MFLFNISFPKNFFNNSPILGILEEPPILTILSICSFLSFAISRVFFTHFIQFSKRSSLIFSKSILVIVKLKLIPL